MLKLGFTSIADTDSQYGLRTNKSTSMALNELTEETTGCIDKKKYAVGIFENHITGNNLQIGRTGYYLWSPTGVRIRPDIVYFVHKLHT